MNLVEMLILAAARQFVRHPCSEAWSPGVVMAAHDTIVALHCAAFDRRAAGRA